MAVRIIPQSHFAYNQDWSSPKMRSSCAETRPPWLFYEQSHVPFTLVLRVNFRPSARTYFEEGFRLIICIVFVVFSYSISVTPLFLF